MDDVARCCLLLLAKGEGVTLWKHGQLSAFVRAIYALCTSIRSSKFYTKEKESPVCAALLLPIPARRLKYDIHHHRITSVCAFYTIILWQPLIYCVLPPHVHFFLSFFLHFYFTLPFSSNVLLDFSSPGVSFHLSPGSKQIRNAILASHWKSRCFFFNHIDPWRVLRGRASITFHIEYYQAKVIHYAGGDAGHPTRDPSLFFCGPNVGKTSDTYLVINQHKYSILLVMGLCRRLREGTRHFFRGETFVVVVEFWVFLRQKWIWSCSILLSIRPLP